jgi:acyl-CoA synthetase (AMP-forming)/AMP-acid ligase II
VIAGLAAVGDDRPGPFTAGAGLSPSWESPGRKPADIVPRPGETVSLAEIVAYLREMGIATFKLPERLELRDELPRNPLGKVLKRELRTELRGS